MSADRIDPRPRSTNGASRAGAQTAPQNAAPQRARTAWWRCRRLLLPLLLLLSGAGPLFAESFPQLPVQTLAGAKVTLPQALAGHPAFLVIGFSQASEKQTVKWRKQVQQDYAGRDGLVVYPVMDIERIPGIFRGLLIAGTRAGVARESWPHFLVVTADESTWKRVVGWNGPDLAYLVLLDRNGEIVWRYSGGYSETAANSLEQSINRLAGTVPTG